MTFLDLDLDFFLDDIPHDRPIFSEERLSDDEFRPWTEERFRQFLEEHCGLSRTKKIPGRVVTHHHEAFAFWKQLVTSGRLTIPFRVAHVDGHADLGQPPNGWDYLLGNVLHRAPADRAKLRISRHHLNPGNYLAFAVGCEWLEELTFVTHPHWDGNDLPHMYFENFDHQTHNLQMRKYQKQDLEHFVRHFGNLADFSSEPVGRPVPLHTVAGDFFRAVRAFDYALLCRSPGFTPASADALIPVFREYIDAI